MDRNHENTRSRAIAHNALAAAQKAALETEKRRQRSMLCAWGSVTAMALVATLGLAEGCAHDHTRVSSEASSSATQQAVVASNEGLTVGASSPLPEIGSVDGDRSVPPDLVAAVSDTFVTAGQAVEVKVEGTPDVTEMALSDGRGDALPMVRDSVGNVWRVGYRVPLRPQQERIALSVTAKNDQHRWRRVWLFIQVDDGQHPIESQSASPDTNR